MKRATLLASASSAPTKRFEKVFGQPGTAVETTSRTHCQIFAFEAYTAPRTQPPAKHTSIRELIGQWEQDEEKRAALEEGRRWVAETFTCVRIAMPRNEAETECTGDTAE